MHTLDLKIEGVHGALTPSAVSRGGTLTNAEMRYGDIGRAEVREKSVLQALAMLKAMVDKND